MDKTYTWDNLDSTVSNTKYLGDASSADWVYSGEPLASNGALVLTMPPKSVGTLVASTHYVWYGKVSAKLKTSRGQGVVTAFILLSDVKDEIDFEFVGVDLNHAQTNYYFQGIPDCKPLQIRAGGTKRPLHTDAVCRAQTTTKSTRLSPAARLMTSTPTRSIGAQTPSSGPSTDR